MKRMAWMGLLAIAAGCGSNGGSLPTCKEGQIPQQKGAQWACVDALTPPTVNTLAQANLDCDNGQVPVFGADGWACGSVTSQSGGDVTAVKTQAGSGLTGGADTGDVSLAVDFAGSGSASSVARSDHSHTFLSLTGLPSGFADLVDNDVLGALACGNQQVPRFNVTTQAWECWTPTTGGSTFVETDPTVNGLAKSSVDGCLDGQVPVRVGASAWSCLTPQDHDTLASLACSDAQVPQYFAGAGTWGCVDLPAPANPNAVDAVAVGPGLTSSRDGGTVQVSVDFGQACASGKVACSDQIQPPITPTLAQVLTQGNDANAQRISNLAPPIGTTDAVTKAYVDALAAGVGASGGTSVVLCCGSGCQGMLPGFNCDQTSVAGGKLVVPLPDDRGMVLVPPTGSPQLLAALPPTTLADGGVVAGNVTLNACATQWSVCTQTGYSAAMLTCGAFASSTDPGPWTCTAPPKAYVVVPGQKGILYVSGDDAANEYLGDMGQPTSPATVIDCSAAPPLPGPGVKTAICFR